MGERTLRGITEAEKRLNSSLCSLITAWCKASTALRAELSAPQRTEDKLINQFKLQMRQPESPVATITLQKYRDLLILSQYKPCTVKRAILHASGYENGHVVAPATVSCSATALYFVLTALLVTALRNASGTVPLRSLPLPSRVILKVLQETQTRLRAVALQDWRKQT